jgi:hypothetical protein
LAFLPPFLYLSLLWATHIATRLEPRKDRTDNCLQGGMKKAVPKKRDGRASTGQITCKATITFLSWPDCCPQMTAITTSPEPFSNDQPSHTLIRMFNNYAHFCPLPQILFLFKPKSHVCTLEGGPSATSHSMSWAYNKPPFSTLHHFSSFYLMYWGERPHLTRGTPEV